MALALGVNDLRIVMPVELRMAETWKGERRVAAVAGCRGALVAHWRSATEAEEPETPSGRE